MFPVGWLACAIGEAVARIQCNQQRPVLAARRHHQVEGEASFSEGGIVRVPHTVDETEALLNCRHQSAVVIVGDYRCSVMAEIHALKKQCKTLAGLVALTALSLALLMGARAQGVFGNAPVGGVAFDFIANGGFAGGGAVAFTPLHDFSVSSVKIWLTGYTGLDMYGNTNQSFYAGIYTDQPAVDPGYDDDQPGLLLASLNVPPPNDGSLAPFDFLNPSSATVLQANTKYWIFIYESTSGSFNYDSYPQWVAGDTPVGDAIYNGSQSFWAFDFSPSSATPAFAINAVPEPGPLWILSGGLLIWGVWQHHRKHPLLRLLIRDLIRSKWNRRPDKEDKCAHQNQDNRLNCGSG